MGLGAVFHHAQIVLPGESEDSIHIRGLAVEVHGHNGFCTARIHRVSDRVDVDKTRRCTAQGYGRSGGRGGVGDGNHFVPCLHTARF